MGVKCKHKVWQQRPKKESLGQSEYTEAYDSKQS